MTRQAYTSTVVAPAQLAVAGVAAVVVAVLSPALHLRWPATVLAAVAIIAVGLHFAVVRLAVGRDRVLISQGPWRWPTRSIAATDVLACGCASLNWAQVFGFGVRFRWRHYRLTVRPGPTLWLDLRGAEHITVSTPDPTQAMTILSRTDAGPGDVRQQGGTA